MKLYKIDEKQQATQISSSIELAESFFQRGKGLLGRTHLEENTVMWIKPCNNIHTFFMKFSIDCIFINKDLKVIKIVSHIKPFRIVGPFWKSNSVIETQAGFAQKWNLKEGDQLYVVN